MATPTNLTIAGYSFACVHLSNADFSDVAAIYVIICVASDRSWKVLDVGQSGELGTRIDSHDRKKCWGDSCPDGNIWVCIHRMPSYKYTKQERLDREGALRRQYRPPCGNR